MKRLALLLALLLPMAASAELKIVGPDRSDPDKLVRLQATGASGADSAGGTVYIWDVSPESKADAEPAADRLIFAGPAGIYRVRVWAVSLKDGKVETARLAVRIGPDPGTPPVVPPGTLSPLAQSIKDAAGADAAGVQLLADAYAASDSWVMDVIDTNKQIRARVDDAEVKALGGGDRLLAVRKIIEADYWKLLPVGQNVGLGPIERAKSRAALKKIGAAMADAAK